MKLSYIAAAVLGLASMSAMADGAWSCSSVTFSDGATVNYLDCDGSFAPPPNDTVAAVNALNLTGAGTLVAQYKDNIDSPEIGSDVPQIDFTAAANGSGSLTFGMALTDPFVLSVKFGREWSAYSFDVDVAAGTSWSFSGGPAQGGGLSHGSLFTSSELVTNPVPEPETYAMMLAGLAAVGFVARRRRPA